MASMGIPIIQTVLALDNTLHSLGGESLYVRVFVSWLFNIYHCVALLGSSALLLSNAAANGSLVWLEQQNEWLSLACLCFIPKSNPTAEAAHWEDWLREQPLLWVSLWLGLLSLSQTLRFSTQKTVHVEWSFPHWSQVRSLSLLICIIRNYLF